MKLTSPAFTAGGEILGGIHFVFDTAGLEAEIAATIRQHLWQAGLVLVLGIALAFYLARSLVRPVRSLTAASRRIAAGDLGATIEAQRHDEIGELAVAMREMSEALRQAERRRAEHETERLRSANRQLELEVAQRQIVQAEREKLIAELEAKADEMEQFSHTVSHDLKSPLVTIRGFLREVEKNLPPGSSEKITQDLERIYSATERMKLLLSDLAEVSRAGRVARPQEPVDLSALAAEALDRERPAIGGR